MTNQDATNGCRGAKFDFTLPLSRFDCFLSASKFILKVFCSATIVNSTLLTILFGPYA